MYFRALGIRRVSYFSCSGTGAIRLTSLCLVFTVCKIRGVFASPRHHSSSEFIASSSFESLCHFSQHLSRMESSPLALDGQKAIISEDILYAQAEIGSRKSLLLSFTHVTTSKSLKRLRLL